MTVVTPGIDFLTVCFIKFGIPSILFAYGLNRFCHIPIWFCAFAGVFAAPLVFTLRIVYKNFHDSHQAAKLGARLAPKVSGRYIGNLDVMMRLSHHWDTGYIADGFLDELGDSHEPIANYYVLWSDSVFTAWPEHIKLVLATDFPNYVKGTRMHDTAASVLGMGVFGVDGDLWKFHRAITRPFFTRERISDFDLFDHHSSTAIAIIKERMRTGCAIDFQDLMARFTMDSASEFLFGHCLHSLKAGIPYPHNASKLAPEISTPETRRANEFSHAFLEAQEIISRRDRYGEIWPLGEIFKDETKKPMEIVHTYLKPIILEAIAKKEMASLSEKADSHIGEDETLIDHLVRQTSDPVILRDETLNIMIAGRDTTAATLTFVMYLLSMHSAVFKRLRDEILEKVGSSRRPDYDDIREMKYLRAVINETLRLFPIVPFNIRESVNATVWPSPDPSKKPIYIPAGTKIPYSVFLMHRRKDLWGPDAEEFDPDRFLDERLKKYLLNNSFIFLPFNAGPRICLGQQFAYNETSYMLIRLLQQFSSIELDLDALPPHARPPPEWANAQGRKAIEKLWPKTSLTMQAYGGLWLRLGEADNA